MQMMKKLSLMILIFSANFTAYSSVIAVGGNAVFMGTAPNDVSTSNIQNSAIMVFNENQNMLINQNMAVDYDLLDQSTQLFGFPTSINPLTGTLFQGRYHSHLIVYNPLVATSSGKASIRFDETVVGVFISLGGLSLSDSIFNSVTSSYDNGNSAIRPGESNDQFDFFANTLNITNLFADATNIDQIRVITTAEDQSVPVNSPALYLVVLFGMAGLFTLRKAHAGDCRQS
ncbi:hypothetical protein ISG33_12030 [Glaciecola sp. MH2013]|uniref:hypothetical protein n=1 Tax=Glaciecola sp. MH2013 TaxID=2785524 RepID=UPI00189E272A|nr:hypothetical protein [Glaciecola sp. MH2013]MBF7074129.1 hypothetical protein [Glaciecola sp. MH2013]